MHCLDSMLIQVAAILDFKLGLVLVCPTFQPEIPTYRSVCDVMNSENQSSKVS